MNTHDIELPPLPEWVDWPVTVSEMSASDVKEAMQDYARAAIEADRQRRGEPVPKGWKLVPETPTSKQIVHMACQIKGADADGWFRTDGDDWPEHVAAAERAYKWALSEAPQPAEPVKTLIDNQEPLGEEFQRVLDEHSWDLYVKTNEPVKVPSEDDLWPNGSVRYFCDRCSLTLGAEVVLEIARDFNPAQPAEGSRHE